MMLKALNITFVKQTAHTIGRGPALERSLTKWPRVIQSYGFNQFVVYDTPKQPCILSRVRNKRI